MRKECILPYTMDLMAKMTDARQTSKIQTTLRDDHITMYPKFVTMTLIIVEDL